MHAVRTIGGSCQVKVAHGVRALLSTSSITKAIQFTSIMVHSKVMCTTVNTANSMVDGFEHRRQRLHELNLPFINRRYYTNISRRLYVRVYTTSILAQSYFEDRSSFKNNFPFPVFTGQSMAAANSTAVKLVIVTWPYDYNYNQFRSLLLLHLPLPNCTCTWVWCWPAPAPNAEVW